MRRIRNHRNQIRHLYLMGVLCLGLISLIGSNNGGVTDKEEAVANADYTLQGVISCDGEGLPSVQVVLTGTQSMQTTTDQNGSYRFVFKEGTYRVDYYSQTHILERQVLSFAVNDFLWTGGLAHGGSNAWGAGESMTVNIEADPLPCSQSITYPGLTTKAAIDEYNAEKLAVTAYLGGSFKEIGWPRLVRIAATVARFFILMNTSVLEGSANTVAGDCGGTAIFSVDVDSSDSFTGEAEYTNFCYRGMSVSGRILFSGLIDDGNFMVGACTFDPLQATSERDAFELSGGMTITDYDLSHLKGEVVFNIVLKDALTSEVYMFYRYIIAEECFSDRCEFELSGRYYHPEYGYVSCGAEYDPATHEPFLFSIPTGLDYPSEGEFRVSGEVPISAVLSAISPDSYSIKIDNFYDENNTIDLGIMLWSDLP